MKYEKPNMDIIRFDEKSITTALNGSQVSGETGGSESNVDDGMWD